jgi:hypothetical protein
LLDNRRLVLIEDKAMARNMVPLFVFDESGVKRFSTSLAQAQQLSAAGATATPSDLRR